METPVASSPPVPTGADSPLGRILGVFLAPARTFAAIARRPGWVAPLLLSTVLSVLGTAVLFPRMDMEAAVREQLAARDETISEERVEKALAVQKRFAPLGYAWAVLAPTLVGLLIAAIFWLSFKAFGWELSFRQSFGATCHAFLPNLLSAILLILFALRLERFNPADIGDLVRSSPAFLVDRHANPVMHSLLQSLDVFSIWVLVLLVVGYSVAAKVTRGRAAAIIGTFWALYVFGKAGLTALFS
jgi:hypothetical protein